MAFELRTKWYRVAVAGDSIDGREITEDEINELAETYDPNFYTANIYNEHVRNWGSYGQVVALKSEKVNKPDSPLIHDKVGLFAVLSPNQLLISLNKQNQKIFTSIEIWPDFQKTGKAYMAGFAITDQPGAVGTEALKFNAKSAPNNSYTNAVDNGFSDYLKEVEPNGHQFNAQHPVKPKQEDNEMNEEQAKQFEEFMANQTKTNAALLEAIQGFSAKLSGSDSGEGIEEGSATTPEIKDFSALQDEVSELKDLVKTQNETISEQSKQFKAIQEQAFGFTDPDGDGEPEFEIC